MVLYVDGVDWQHELGEASDGTTFYPDLESLKKHSRCWTQCGVVKVTVTFEDPEWVEPQNFDEENQQV